MVAVVNQPTLGEIQRGCNIEKQPDTYYKWSACELCGKQRWVNVVRGESRSKRCRCCVGKKYGVDANHWKGGKINKDGYVLVRLNPQDNYYPMVNAMGYVREHRLMMAQYLGRCLYDWEMVHHKNGIRTDNRVENLHLTLTENHKLGYGQAFQEGYELGYKKGVENGRS